MPELNGFPGNPEVWLDKESGQHYVVYFVPGDDPQVPLIWEIDTENLQGAFGAGQTIVISREFESTAQLWGAGALDRGDHKEIVNSGDDPYIAWENTVTNQAAVRPWLLEDDVRNLVMEGLIEGRVVSSAEFQQTEWWQTHTVGEREWLLLSVADPLTADQRLESNRIAIADSLSAFGIDNATDSLIDYINIKATTGVWTETMWKNQARALADPFSGIEIDAGLQEILDTSTEDLDVTASGEESVRNLMREWLGPTYGVFPQDQVEEWAGRLRNNPDAESELINYLRGIRKAQFTGYDESQTYDQIAQPWRNFWSQALGETPDETDEVFLEVLNNNDAAQNGALLREEGLKRGNEKVLADVQGQFARQFGVVRRGV